MDAAAAAPRNPWGDEAEEDLYRLKKVRNHRSFFNSPRGISLFTQSWLPLNAPPGALMFMVHGYGNDTSWTFQNTAFLFTQMRCAAFAIDLEGHGQSEGLKGFVPNVDHVAQDCLSFFASVKQREEFSGLPCFLYGESLGAAICLLMHFVDPKGWDGAILVAPMCKISEKMKPPWPLPAVLTMLASLFPTWAIVPSQDLVDKSIKDPRKRELGRNNPRRYAGKPRLGTVTELLRVTSYLEKRLEDVSLPFLILHGDADVVTDPSISRALFERAKSEDKTLKLYQGMQHSLLQGETEENVKMIVADISSWLEDRIDKTRKYV